MAKLFYVTLQSNASMDFFPQNKISDVKNRLGTSVSFPPGEWEVAMTDMSYTAGLSYIRKGDVLFTRNSLPNSSFEIINATSAYTIELRNPNEVIVTTDKLRHLLGLKSNTLCYEKEVIEVIQDRDGWIETDLETTKAVKTTIEKILILWI